MSVERDFTENSRQELLKMVKEVEDEKYTDFTDWVGDRWLDFEKWIGQLDINKYINNVNSYHKKVIDKNNTTEKEINDIFNAVNNISTLYRGRFAAILTSLENYNTIIQKMNETINPGNGSFNTEYIGSNLGNTVKRLIDENKYCNDLVNKGLNKKSVEDIPKDVLQSLLEKYAKAFLNNTNIKAGEKLEIPIGLNTIFYYKVDAKAGDGDIDINLEIEDQRVKLSSIDFSEEVGPLTTSVNTNGKVNSSLKIKDTETQMSNDGTLQYSKEMKNGDYTYKSEFKLNLLKQEIELINSVSKKINTNGSITSSTGIKTSGDRNTNWQPIPAAIPQEETNPGAIKIPSFDVDWQKTAYGVGTTLLIGTVVIGTIIFAPEALPFLALG